MNFVIAANHDWYECIVKNLEDKVTGNFIYINKKEDLTKKKLMEIDPKYVFFPHWSYIIPADIYNNFECIIFHMTDVPFGRGGSPLQNLISRGIYDTKITALQCQKDLDAGPVYMKKPFSLYGNAEEIYMRAAKVIEEMIRYIIIEEPKAIEQSGDPVYFRRRTPQESEIESIQDLNKLFDHIRMLDADGYPKAFLETDKFKFEFERASLKQDFIQADVKIRRK